MPWYNTVYVICLFYGNNLYSTEYYVNRRNHVVDMFAEPRKIGKFLFCLRQNVKIPWPFKVNKLYKMQIDIRVSK